MDELNQQESRYKSNIGSSQVGFESLRFELKTRDDIIQKLRKEVLILQEKRDQIYADVRLRNNKLFEAFKIKFV